MFGRVRRQSCPSADTLELHSTPKLIKSDSLSIYEATLIKLKQGSARNPAPLSDQAVPMDSEKQLDGNRSKSIFCFFTRRQDSQTFDSSSSCEAGLTDGRSMQLSEVSSFRGMEGVESDIGSPKLVQLHTT